MCIIVTKGQITTWFQASEVARFCQCRGSLELDCRDFNNSGVEQCFVNGAAEPQPCKPAAASQAYPALTQALATGQALDGNEGSLCVLNTGAPAPDGARSPFIPASAGGGGCNLGLNCLTLGVSTKLS